MRSTCLACSACNGQGDGEVAYFPSPRPDPEGETLAGDRLGVNRFWPPYSAAPTGPAPTQTSEVSTSDGRSCPSDHVDECGDDLAGRCCGCSSISRSCSSPSGRPDRVGARWELVLQRAIRRGDGKGPTPNGWLSLSGQTSRRHQNWIGDGDELLEEDTELRHTRYRPDRATR